MAPAAAAIGFSAIGGVLVSGAATSVASAVFMGAAVGAVIGAGTALVTGKDPLKGALMGAISGGATAGVGQAISGAATAAGTAATSGAGVAAPTLPAATSGMMPPVPPSVMAPSVAAPVAAAPTTAGSGSTGILSGVSNWINKNPMPAAIVAQGVGGAASGIAENRSADKELDALMERDRLNNSNQQINLSGMDLKTPLPSIGAFMDKPKWAMPTAGLKPAGSA
jgi:hypothetical protein